MTFGFANHAKASNVDDCYVKANIQQDKRIMLKTVIVLLDETTVFDGTQKKHIADHLTTLVEPGTHVAYFAFSAFIQDKYMRPLFEYRIAGTLDESIRNNLRKDSLKDFDTCMLVAGKKAKNLILSNLENYHAGTSEKISKSDIFAAIKDVGDSVLTRAKTKEKIIVLVSDMLENSGVSSFYSPNGGPRAINVAEELKKAQTKGMISDLRRSHIYVIGAGVFPASQLKSAGNGYRSQDIMGSLMDFWSQYFLQSNAELKGFGKPMLMNPIAGTH
jgi:hypothetical protein